MSYNKVKDITDIFVDYEDTPELEEYRKDLVTTQNLDQDHAIEEMIREDIGTIYQDVGYQDGMYANFPFTRVIRDEKGIRVYALTNTGGVVITYTDDWEYRIITLGEDDGYFFPRGANNYECTWDGVQGKANFVWAVTEAISTFNALKLD